MSLSHPHIDLTIGAVTDSCRVARSVQARLAEVQEITKDDRSPVTVADFAVQAIVSLALHEINPAMSIVGEEHADVLRQPDQAPVLEAVVDAVRSVRASATPDDVLGAIDRCDHDATGSGYWVLDPIDGTKGFLRGQQYAIALAWIEQGEVTLGMLGCPNLPASFEAPLDEADAVGTIYGAAAGGGAWELSPVDPDDYGLPIEASEFDGERAVRICESVEKGHSKQSDTARIVETLGCASTPVRLDSQCKYAVVARGQADAYLRLPTSKGYVEKIWDHAAGSLVASEAGAVVTDITGAPLDFKHGRRLETNRGIVCATGDLHGRVIEAIKSLGIGADV